MIGGLLRRRRSYPPAWYRDPSASDVLRRWNGWRWTSETRTYPSWLRQVPVATGPRRRSPSALLWAAAAICLLAALASLMGGPDRGDPERIGSSSFAAQANALCQATADHFDETDADHPSRAARTRARADAWTAMVASLRALEVEPRDRFARDRWLAAWDQWIVEGRAYAAALADGDAEAAQRASERSEPSKRVIDRTAIASGMPACRFVN